MSEASVLRTTYFESLIELLNENDEAKVREYLDLFENNTENVQKYSNKLSMLKNLEWLNVGKELSYEDDLRGKLVLFDFWTYCCINCIHVIPLLKRLEEKFENLLVIGVHSAKFPNEKSKKNIEHAVRRNLIKHPVVCDNDLGLWTDLEVNCWPTFMVLNPHGQIIAEFQGELQANLIERFIEACFKYYGKALVQSKLESFSIGGRHDVNDASSSLSLAELCFPSKLSLDMTKSVLFITDSGNNRVLAVDGRSGELHYVIGASGLPGCQDGSFEEASFRWPQGTAYDADEQCLYVADTGNDLIRVVDLQSRNVKTLAGKCVQNIGDYDYTGGKPAQEQTISSPWDVCLLKRGIEKFLIIACAGTHQIWLYTFKTSVDQQPIVWWRNVSVTPNTLVCIAGNGKERNRNNSYPLQASFAQPSGLSVDKANENVYIADAESSTIRVLSLKDGAVKNVAGGDSSQPDNLFAFGDVDGAGAQVRLQHPMDVKCLSESELIVADAYNNKLKMVNVKAKSSRTICVEQLLEPNGLCVDHENSVVFVADTNSHLVRVIRNISTEPIVSNLTINFSSVYPGISVTDNKAPAANAYSDKIIVKFKQVIHLNETAPSSWSIEIVSDAGELTKMDGKIPPSEESSEFEITSIDLHKLAKINLKLNIFYCFENPVTKEQLCKMLRYKQEFTREQLTQMKARKAIFIEIDSK